MKALTIFILLAPLVCFAEPLLVFNTTGKSPLNTDSGEGFMDKVTEVALLNIGYKLQLVKLPAERGLVNVNQGIDDAEMSRIAGLEKTYKNIRQVPEKIMDWEFVVFSKKKVDLTKGWSSLANKNIAFINGWKILEKNVPASANINKVKTDNQLFLLLEKDRTDFVIYEKWAGLEQIRKHNLADIRMLEPALAIRDMYIYLNKKHEKLVKPLSKSLKEMKDNGDYRKLEKRILLGE